MFAVLLADNNIVFGDFFIYFNHNQSIGGIKIGFWGKVCGINPVQAFQIRCKKGFLPFGKSIFGTVLSRVLSDSLYGFGQQLRRGAKRIGVKIRALLIDYRIVGNRFGKGYRTTEHGDNCADGKSSDFKQ